MSLPDELLLNILVYLNDTDIIRVRHVCHQSELKSIDELGHRCFRRLIVLHDKRSVARLQKITELPKFNDYVRSITMGRFRVEIRC
jgi:hypothetical protein